MRLTVRSTLTVAAGLVVVCSGIAAGQAPAASQAPAAGKIPITTASADARRLYLEGRTLAENLRATDARKLYEQAVAADKDFALAYVGLATTAGTNQEFIDAVTRAATLVSGVSEGERHMVLGLEAGMKADPAGQEMHYKELVRLFPNDERAHGLLGNIYFGRQDYTAAIEHYRKSIAIDPRYAPAYNQLGYAYRFVEKYPDAEQTFKKYVELIPGDPNPYDSYAELLMKMGRFQESIAMYEKALAIDKNFVASYVGIGNNHLFMGHPDQAREAFGRLNAAARTTGERRQAHLWTAWTYVDEGATDKAIDELQKGRKLAEAEGDFASAAGDLNQIGDVLREAGRFDEALASYREAMTTIAKARVPDEVKQATRRNAIFEQARVAAAKGDLATAKARHAEYSKEVTAKNRPFEVLQLHELAGTIALGEKRYADAVRELTASNLQDPRVLLMLAEAHQGAGDAGQARTFAKKAAAFNALNFNSAFVRTKAKKMATS
jgi:tetratricopeptide (TPR) repeat protein